MYSKDNDWRRVVEFLTGVVDSKLSRAEMTKFGEDVNSSLHCMARRLTDIQTTVGDDVGDIAACTRKAHCLSCDKITHAQLKE